MQINIKTINRAINRKFHRPLKDGCIYNISKLDNEKRVKRNNQFIKTSSRNINKC